MVSLNDLFFVGNIVRGGFRGYIKGQIFFMERVDFNRRA